jgi:hypothetical protein
LFSIQDYSGKYPARRMRMNSFGTVALLGIIIAAGLLMLGAQPHIANNRLANKRRNPEDP